MSESIGIWVEHAYQIHASRPVIEHYISKNADITVFTNPPYFHILNTIAPKVRVVGIDSLRSRIGSRLHLLFRSCFIRDDFSVAFPMLQSIRLKGKFKLINKVVPEVLKPSNRTVNRRYAQFFGLLYRWRLIKKIPGQFDKIIAYTKLSQPYHLIPFQNRLTLFMESWDHPAKEPYLLTPATYSTWNHDLATDSKTYQFISECRISKTNKFSYIQENIAEKAPLDKAQTMDLSIMSTNKVVVYPVCTASNFFGFNEEVEVISKIGEILKDSGYCFYIRPYPLCPQKDIEILRAIPNAFVGYQHSYTGGLDIFDPSVQRHKYELLKQCAYVLNLGTTFILDAALADTKVIQIVLPRGKWPNLDTMMTQHHIQYLIKKETVLLKKEPLLFQLANYSPALQKYLKNWVFSKTETRM